MKHKPEKPMSKLEVREMNRRMTELLKRKGQRIIPFNTYIKPQPKHEV